MPDAKHTSGRMKHAAMMGSITVGSRDEAIFHCGLGLRPNRLTDEQRANARRLVACWNAFEGVSTEEIERLAQQPVEGESPSTKAATLSLQHTVEQRHG